MYTIQKRKDREELDNKLLSMPWYVDKFINFKLPDLSPSTLLEYVRDYETFFDWLLVEGLTSVSTRCDIPLEVLETLRVENIDAFKIYLSTKKENANSKTTVSRKLASLRSLFHYLSQIAEDEDLYPLLKRNVMAKFKLSRIQKPDDTAARLKGKLLQDEEITEFIHYVQVGYKKDIAGNKQALHSYLINLDRDVCLISLILNSGLRVSEAVNLNVEDVDLMEKTVNVIRKGQDDSFKTPVHFRKEALEPLQRYIQIRESTYKPAKKEKAFFLAVRNGQAEGQRMSKRAIQEMVLKYARRFGKPNLSVHKLRHSFATDYYLQNDLYTTQGQLGHSSPETTQIYAHLTDKTMAKAIDNRKKKVEH